MSQLLLWLNNMNNKVFEKFEIRFNKKKESKISLLQEVTLLLSSYMY
jgi:hypothetical protein